MASLTVSGFVGTSQTLRLNINGEKTLFNSFRSNSQRKVPSISTIKLRIVARAAGSTYICTDCGYIYNERGRSFETLSSDYRCPVCQAPKRRFKPYKEPVEKNANSLAVRKARKEQLKRDESIGGILPKLVALIVLLLVGVTIYLNSVL